MLLFLLELGVAAWIALGLGVIALLSSAFKYKTTDTNRIGLSFAWFAVAVGLVLFAFFPLVKSWGVSQFEAADWGATAVSVAKYIGYWLVAGLVVGSFYWVSFVRDTRARYDENLEKVTKQFPNSPRPVQKAIAIGLDRFKSIKNVFLDDGYVSPFGNDLVATEETPEAEAERLARVEATFNEEIPPRISKFKAEVTYAATIWPVTLISLVFADLLRHVWNYIQKYWHRFLDKVSRLAWGAPVV
jgi:hypothetical protein